MKNFLSLVLTWALLILSCGLFYLAATFTFTSAFMNIALLITAVFVLIQAFGQIDKRHGFGRYSEESSKDKDKLK